MTLLKNSKTPLDAHVVTEGRRVGVTALTGIKAMRQLNAALMDLAVYVAQHPGEQAVLLLEEPEISDERLTRLGEEVSSVFVEEILASLSCRIVQEGGKTRELWPCMDHRLSATFPSGDTKEILNRIRANKPAAMRRPSDSYYEVLRVLLIHWIRQDGFSPKKALQQETGYSFQTVQKVLKELDPWIAEDSSKSVRLESFPKTAWNRLVNLSVEVRASSGYTVSEGEIRPISAMREKLAKKKFFDGRVAMGGVAAGRYYDPAFDLVGSPRLDLCLHHKKSLSAETVLKALDPALRPVRKGESPHVVIHTLFRTESFFREEAGEVWVDEVECLLDLLDSRLVEQADRLFETFKKGKSE